MGDLVSLPLSFSLSLPLSPSPSLLLTLPLSPSLPLSLSLAPSLPLSPGGEGHGDEGGGVEEGEELPQQVHPRREKLRHLKLTSASSGRLCQVADHLKWPTM